MEFFSIPHEGQRLIYFPFHKIVLLGNATLVNLVHRATQGEPAALQELREALADKCSDIRVDPPLQQALRTRQEPGPFRPTSVTLLLTEDCTLRCRYCYAHGGRSQRTMPWDIVTGVIDVIFDNAIAEGRDTITVNFHGGDAGAIWPLFVKTREYLRDKEAGLGIHVVTSVGTNGVLDDAQRHWLTSNIDSATLSMDGPPPIHDSQRIFPDGMPSSHFVLKTIQHFDRVGFPYGIRSTITQASVSCMAEIAQYICTNSNARRIQMEPMFPQGRAAGGNMSAPTGQEFIDNFRKAREVASGLGRTLCYSGARLDVLTTVFCKACGDSCVVTPLGEISSCYEVADAADPLAQVFFFGRYDPQTRSFTVDEERRQRLFQLSVLDQPECKDCFCKWHCAGDCPSKRLATQTNDGVYAPDRCLINRALTLDRLVEALHSPR